MPVCPNCNYEYVEGVTICPDCKTTLVDEKELKQFEELTEDDWVIVYTTNYEYDAEMLKDNLESAGIAANILSQKDHNFPAPGDFSVIKLLVRRDDMTSALNFINEVKKNQTSEGEDEEQDA